MSNQSKALKAGLIIVGDEILSGRTQDANAKWIAEKLAEKGISLAEIRVSPDNEAIIIGAVKDLKDKVDYLFTTGGIGPTHDDVTAESVAKAFGVKLVENAEALAILKKHYGPNEEINEARMKMALIPQGANLILNPVSGAPGFIVGNVYVMAGVPRIMQGMLENILPTLRDGAIIYSNALTCSIPESKIAKNMTQVQAKYPDVSIGSYPHFRPGITSLSIVMRSADKEQLKAATIEMIALVEKLDDAPPALSLQVEIDD